MYNKSKINEKTMSSMLVIYPIALYTATFACYFILILTHSPFWLKMAFIANAAGVLIALIGALPAFLDWSLGMNEKGKEKFIGVRHMLCNIIALLFFAVNLISNCGQLNTLQPEISNAVFLSAVGLFCTIVANLLGLKLTYQSQIGIDPLLQQEIEDAIHVIDPAVSH